MFKLNEIVIIKKYKDDETNCKGRVTAIDQNLYHVSNMNMPFMGSVNKWFYVDDLKKI